MFKIVQTSLPYDEIKISFRKNQVEITLLNQGQPVAIHSASYTQYADIHLTNLEGKLRTIPS